MIKSETIVAFTLLCLISLFQCTFKVYFIACGRAVLGTPSMSAGPRTKRAALNCKLLIKPGGITLRPQSKGVHLQFPGVAMADFITSEAETLTRSPYSHNNLDA